MRCAANDIRVVMNGPPVLDLYDEVDREVPLKGKRWVIAHINDFSPRDVERIVRMGLVLTTHTNNYLYKGLHVHAKRLPPERHDEIVPLRSLLDAGVKVSLATDNVPISNFLPVSQTILRTSYVTKQRIAPEQALTRMEALRCATADGAYLTFDEDKKRHVAGRQIRRPRRAQRRSADGRGEPHRGPHVADDHGRRPHRARDAELGGLAGPAAALPGRLCVPAMRPGSRARRRR